MSMSDATSPAQGRSVSSSSHETDIVGFDPELLDRAAELHTTLFGGTAELNRDYLVWKYLQNPYLGDPLVHFAVRSGQLVGMYGTVGTCWDLRGHRHVLAYGCDFGVDPRFRRQGIARQLQRAHIAELRARGLGMAFSFSGGAMGTATQVSGGWHVVAMLDELEVLTKTAPWSPALSRVTQRARSLAGRMLSERSRLLVQRTLRSRSVDPLSALNGDENEHVEVLAIDAFDRLADIAARVPPKLQMRHVRDAEYFRWRLGNPRFRYQALASENAYLILQWNPTSRRVNLVDWGALDARALAQVASVALRQIGSARVWALSLDPGFRSILESLGSLIEVGGSPSTFTMHDVTDDGRGARLAGQNLAEAGSWELRMLDSDSY
jgi:ribosomal protein S18 acetylase RimI-like enzyme